LGDVGVISTGFHQSTIVRRDVLSGGRGRRRRRSL